MSKQQPLVVIVGPTGVGKTALSIRLAQALDGEVISADSRQIYRGMDIGTAKPTPAERAAVPHHLIDVIDPDASFSLAEFQERAYAAIDAVAARGHVPMLVGGTGQYIRAVVEGWHIPRVPPDPALRARLRSAAERDGAQALYERLIALDPGAADLIDPRNVRRVVRALEVCLQTGEPFTAQRGKTPPPYTVCQLGLTMARPALYSRVDERVDAMVAAGLVREVHGLLSRGYGWRLPAMSSLGYRQLRAYLEGTCSLEEAVDQIKTATHRFIRQQYTWFRLDDPAICWIDAAADPYPAALAHVVEALGCEEGP
ncbi:MAG: tRNA (adenosine(37)-N6)-dimethylallyltransferase MiaA [Anaerolineae bacterium]|nr:tRNA (adenosine(37)-N6)-dimethylallyltransferase MiaA [Anaerolineae bacterium]